MRLNDVPEKERAMVRLQVRELAQAKLWGMSQLSRETGISLPSIRRYWYNTKDGKKSGPPLAIVDLTIMESIARALGVRVADLIIEGE